MAKKKSSKANRKHEFKYAAPSATVVVPSAKAASGTSVTAAVIGGTTQRDFSYVGRDLRRIVLLGSTLILLQLVLWYLFDHTGLGSSVYNLVQL
jgi:hypothetical protein